MYGRGVSATEVLISRVLREIQKQSASTVWNRQAFRSAQSAQPSQPTQPSQSIPDFRGVKSEQVSSTGQDIHTINSQFKSIPEAISFIVNRLSSIPANIIPAVTELVEIMRVVILVICDVVNAVYSILSMLFTRPGLEVENGSPT